MKSQISNYIILVSLMLSSCIKKVDSIIVDKTYIVIHANLKYPANDLSINILETSNNTSDNRPKPIEDAKIRLYTKSKNGNSELIVGEDGFNFLNSTNKCNF